MLEAEIINNRYRILGVIGEGGMANIYLADDIINNQKVAIKKLKTDKIQHIDINSKRFFREANFIANVTSNEHLVKIYDLLTYGDNSYIVMEYIQGETLKKYLATRVNLHYKEAVNITLQICSGIKAIHKEKIVHRDIKPDNIILQNNGVVKIIDLGIAWKEGEEHWTRDGNVVGSPQYLSPEAILQPTNISNQTDIYPVGIILYEMIKGSLPYSGIGVWDVIENHVRGKIPLLKADNIDCPTEIDYIIQKCTAKSISRRYKNIDELIADLKKIEVNSAANTPITKLKIEKIESFQKPRITKKFRKTIKKQREKELPWFSKQNFIFLLLLLAIICIVLIVLGSLEYF